MELRHELSQRYHVKDVIRGVPATVADLSVWSFPTNEALREAVPGTDSIEAEPERTITGYPVVFNRWTEIQSWDGPFMERVLPGAADRTLARRSDKITLMFNHGFDMVLEQTPIGRWLDFTPDDRGVRAEGALLDRGVNEKVDTIAELIRMGAIWGQSFRFSVEEDVWRDDPDPSPHNPKGLPERDITQFRWFEAGPVTYPAYEATTVGLRSSGDLSVPVRDRVEFFDYLRRNDALPSATPKLMKAAALRRITRSDFTDELAGVVRR